MSLSRLMLHADLTTAAAVTLATQLSRTADEKADTQPVRCTAAVGSTAYLRPYPGSCRGLVLLLFLRVVSAGL
jgi:hypothetical protein